MKRQKINQSMSKLQVLSIYCAVRYAAINLSGLIWNYLK